MDCSSNLIAKVIVLATVKVPTSISNGGSNSNSNSNSHSNSNSNSNSNQNNQVLCLPSALLVGNGGCLGIQVYGQRHLLWASLIPRF